MYLIVVVMTMCAVVCSSSDKKVYFVILNISMRKSYVKRSVLCDHRDAMKWSRVDEKEKKTANEHAKIYNQRF